MENDIEKNLQIQEGRKTYVTKLKTRLVLVIPMFVLSVLSIVIGVLFLPKSSQKIDLFFSFNSSNASAQIKRQDLGAKSSNNILPLTFSPESSSPKVEIDSWSNSVEFNESQNDITITISVVNTADCPIWFKVQKLSNEVDNLKVDFSSEEAITIESLKSGAISITLSAINKNVQVKNSQLKFQILLGKV